MSANYPNMSASEHNKTNSETNAKEPSEFKLSWSLWCIFSILCLFSFISALDGTIITTSLPVIARDIGNGGSERHYVWIAQCFLFSSTVPQPLYGQLANIFGRRNPFLVAIALFTLGSGISGGARSVSMLIAGRTIQGLGGAGLNILSDILICDLVPPRFRGPYLAAVLSTAGVGSTIGPIIGGALAEANWRWIFYLNLPICGFGSIMLVLLLKVNYTRSTTWVHALQRVDYLGTAIFIPAMVSLFYALITGGVEYPWSSWRILLPLILGLCGWAAFHVQQATPQLCRSPSMPTYLFTNRTSATGYILVFLSSVTLQMIAYFLPLYFQAVKLSSSLLSGVYYLPFALTIIPCAGVAGWALSKWGRYIPLHYAGFAFIATGSGLFSMLDVESTRADWIGFQILPSAGIALVYTSTMPSVLAPLDESDVAVATATYSFLRSLGFVWGVTMAGIVFNGQVDRYLYLAPNDDIRQMLRGGGAYALAAEGEGLRRLGSVDMVRQVQEVYVRALRVVWLTTMAVALLGFVCVPFEKAIKLRKEHSTEFGLAEKDAPSNGVDPV
jgi:MFS family permease